MTATLTVVQFPQEDHPQAHLVELIQASVDAVCEHTGFAREQFVLAGPHQDLWEAGDASDEMQELVALPVTDDTIAAALDSGEPVDLHVVIDAPEDIVLPLLLQCDPLAPSPQVVVSGDDAGLDARGLLLALIGIWPAELGFVADEAVLEVADDYVLGFGQITWLSPALRMALEFSDVPQAEEAAGGWLFTLPHGFGDPAAAEDARAIVDAMDAD